MDDSQSNPELNVPSHPRAVPDQAFTALLHGMSVPACVFARRSGELIDANQALAAMLARPSPHSLVVDTGFWRDPETLARLLDPTDRLEGVEVEATVVTAEGEAVPVLVKVDQTSDFSILQFQDLRPRQLSTPGAEAQRRLEEAQAIARMGNFTYDLESREITGSPQLFELLGLGVVAELSMEEAFTHIDAADRDGIVARAKADLEGRTQFVWEYRVRVADSETRYHRLTGRVQRNAGGGGAIVYGTVQDVTDQREAEADRLAFEKKAQEAQKLESLGVLSGGIAHDFNNLLAGVMGNAELALMENLPEAARNYIEDVRSASRRAAELTRQLLAYSGRARTVFEMVNLNDLAGEMAQLLKLSITDHCQLRVSSTSAEHIIQADTAQIRQVLMNLIINASEAIDHPKGEVTVRIGELDCLESFFVGLAGAQSMPAGRYVYVEVEDNGAGMEAQVRARIFEPFYTTKFAGRGLGLAAVLGILRSHRAAVRIQSEPGKGTRIAAYFPAPESSQVTRPVSVKNDGARKKGMILVVDDEPAVRDLLHSVLTKFGFDAVLAEGGEQGVELFEQHANEISLVLLDMSMPDMDGVETLQRLRQRSKSVSVLVMSGYSEEDTMNRFRELGVEGFIAKPFPVGDVVQRVHTLLGNDPTRG